MKVIFYVSKYFVVRENLMNVIYYGIKDVKNISHAP